MGAYPMYKSEFGEPIPMFRITAIDKLANNCWLLAGNDPAVLIDPRKIYREPEVGDWWYRTPLGNDSFLCNEAREDLIASGFLSREPEQA